MGNAKPYLQAACVCENILIEPDTVPSLIRIVGKFIITPPDIEMPKGIPTGFPMKLFVSFKRGDSIGKGKVSVYGTRPDGSDGPKTDTEVVFPGGVSGTAQIKADFHIIDPQAGTYWFNVLWDDELITKIPVEVEITKPAQPPVASVTVPLQKSN